jgi:hypothetical protein
MFCLKRYEGGGGEEQGLISNGNIDPPLLEQGVKRKSQNGQKSQMSDPKCVGMNLSGPGVLYQRK